MLWHAACSGRAGLFQEWELRDRLAGICSVSPLVACDDSAGVEFLFGLEGNTVSFFGGRFYNERNAFPVALPTAPEVITAALACGSRARFLSIESDPIRIAEATSRIREVPYNQYWVFDPPDGWDNYLSTRSSKRRKRIRGFFKNDAVSIQHVHRQNPLDDTAVMELMEMHDASLRARDREPASADPVFHTCLRATLDYLLKLDCLYEVRAHDGPSLVGYGIIAYRTCWRHAVYLVNFFDPAHGDASHMVIAAATKFGCDRGVPIDGMRGSFGLKRSFKFSPEPAYALVADPNWIVRVNNDLSSEEELNLYGRLPGR